MSYGKVVTHWRARFGSLGLYPQKEKTTNEFLRTLDGPDYSLPDNEKYINSDITWTIEPQIEVGSPLVKPPAKAEQSVENKEAEEAENSESGSESEEEDGEEGDDFSIFSRPASMGNELYVINHNCENISCFSTINGEFVKTLKTPEGSAPIKICASDSYVHVLCEDNTVHTFSPDGEMSCYNITEMIGDIYVSHITCDTYGNQFSFYSPQRRAIYTVRNEDYSDRTEIITHSLPLRTLAFIESLGGSEFLLGFEHDTVLYNIFDNDVKKLTIPKIGSNPTLQKIRGLCLLSSSLIACSIAGFGGVAVFTIDMRFRGFVYHNHTLSSVAANRNGDIFFLDEDESSISILRNFRTLFTKGGYTGPLVDDLFA